MISRDLVEVLSLDSPITLATVDRKKGEEWVPGGANGRFYLQSVPSCLCCGEPAWPNKRCTKHQDRNPCVVEGCSRTMPARGWLRDDDFLCGEHWRAFCPPGSPIRKAFNRLGRIARKMGFKRHDRWPKELQARRWRLWDGLIRRIRRGNEGHIDEQAIRSMFGWTED